MLTHIICGTLDPENAPTGFLSDMTVAPPSETAVEIPMHTHPSRCKYHPALPRWTYKDRIAARRDPVHEGRMRSAPGVNGSDWGEYITLVGKDDRLTSPMMAFFADSHLPLPVLLPALKNSQDL